MAKKVGNITKFSGGFSDSDKEGPQDSYKHGRAIDYRSDAREITINPKTKKQSSSFVLDLPKWMERVNQDVYIYDKSGNLYKRDSSDTFTHPNTAADSTGNGLSYFGEDNYLYYAQDEVLGRFGPIGADIETWYDNFLGSEGGVPTNTNSVDFEASSSQYASRADTASLSITSDLTLSTYIKPESLPSTGNSMTLISKWDESGTTQSYKMDIAAISNFFGDGSDGAKTISSNTTETIIEAAASGTSGTKTISATHTSFAAGQKILIYQSRGSGAGTPQLNEIQSYTAGTITTVKALNATYTSSGSDRAQVLVMKQYTNVTVDANKTWKVKNWDDLGEATIPFTGGIMAFYANGTVTVNGTIESGNGYSNSALTFQGEGTAGLGTSSLNANGSGGGGGTGSGSDDFSNGGAGGGNGTAGTDGGAGNKAITVGGTVAGSADLTTVVFGGGGGSAGLTGGGTGTGGSGGGMIMVFGATITMGANGSISANGIAGNAANPAQNAGGGGGGAGGSILLKAQTATLGSGLITATGGAGGAKGGTGGAGGAGGTGRIHLDYSSSFTGTTSPTLDSIVDDNLASTDGYALRLSVSSDGDNSETLSKDITGSIDTSTWVRWAITWDASGSLATFYRNGVSIGTNTGTFTTIHDNASTFAIGMNTSSGGAAENFYDGLMDDVRVWNDIRTATELKSKNDVELVGTEPGLIAYYELDDDYTDSQTSGLNDLTASGSPVFSTDVPFSGVTTRTNLDQSLDTTGNTYTLTTSINEGATHRQSFVPSIDPQLSVEVLVAAIGTGDWTLTVHDALNREIAAKTIVNGNMVVGDNDFIFSSVWRPIIGATYHFHLTSTVADGTVTTTDASDLETVDFHTYYQFLVSDEYHPMRQHLNFLAIGNERYIATHDGQTYTPNKITLPSGHRVRSLSFWREYLAIGTWQGTTITDADEGRIFFWDGISDTYNFFIDVPEGGINAMQGTRGILYIVAGYSGDFLAYQGGTAAETVKAIPGVKSKEKVEILPGAMTMYKSLIRLGISGDSDADDLEKGVWTWGSTSRAYQDSLSYDFPISTGTRTGDTLKIGSLLAVGQELLIGWQDNVSYGIDSVTVTNDPYADATYESLVVDYQSISKSKYPLVLRTDFKPLVSGESIEIKKKVDRASAFTVVATEDTVGATTVRYHIRDQAKEIEIGVNLKTTTTTSPTVTGLSLEIEDPRDRGA